MWFELSREWVNGRGDDKIPRATHMLLICRTHTGHADRDTESPLIPGLSAVADASSVLQPGLFQKKTVVPTEPQQYPSSYLTQEMPFRLEKC